VVQIAGYGQTSTSLFVADPFKLTATATLPACAPGDRALTFVWSETSGYFTAAERLTIATLSPRSIQVPEGMMVARRTYRFTVTAFVAGAASVNASATLSVYAKPSPLFASVAGGSSRLQSRLKAVVLDGRGSNDPDLPASSAHLTYRWACFDHAAQGPCTFARNGTELALPATAVTAIGARWLRAGLFRVTHFVLCAADGRNSSSAVELELVATEVSQAQVNRTAPGILAFCVLHGRLTLVVFMVCCGALPRGTLRVRAFPSLRCPRWA
jgi:hypothetical protein